LTNFNFQFFNINNYYWFIPHNSSVRIYKFPDCDF